MSQLNILIERAASIVGSEYQLAKALGMQQPTISAWKSGKRACSPTDRAALADIAGADPVAEAIEGVLAGIDLETPKGLRARDALKRAMERLAHGTFPDR
jgi:DNA-binding transcriptional regulator YdaS (Cro superfamily)